MLARQVASRRATTSILAATRTVTRGSPITAIAARSISLWPFRKRIDPSLPVYFQPAKPKLSSYIRPMGKKIRYAAFSLAVYFALFQIFMSFVFDPLLDWSDEEWEKMSEKEKKAMEKEAVDDEEPIAFFAWPFSTYQEPSPPYKGSDPEWKEFVAINQDKKRQKEIRALFGQEVKKRLVIHPTVQKLMGGQNAKVSRAWLDIIYPPTPPPTHYVSGIIVDEDGIFWGYRAMDELSMNYMKSILYPKAVVMAMWAFYTTLIPESFSRVFTPQQKESEGPSWQDAILTRGKMEDKPIPQTGAPLFVPPKQNNPQNAGSLQGMGTDKPPYKVDPKGQLVSVDGSLKGTIGAAVFNAYRSHLKKVEPAVNKGSVQVDGMIEFKGKGGLLTVMAVGWYDPKQKKFTHTKVVTKSFKPFQQRPMGGR